MDNPHQTAIVRKRCQRAPGELPSDLYPVIRRLYANRGVTGGEGLSVDLEGLLPPDSLGIRKAANQLAEECSAHTLERLSTQSAHWQAAAESQAGLVVEALKEKATLEKENQKFRRALFEAAQKVEEITISAQRDAEKKDAAIAALTRQLKSASRFKAV